VSNDKWLEAYCIWSSALDLPRDHPRVALAVVKEKVTQSYERANSKRGD